ncbi:MAG: hypothetical protein H6644_17095 [Caldilineaceae bacterium]|nr:hypothetical protein [Caldilineaceae bacterium]
MLGRVRRDIVHSPRPYRPGVNPPGCATTPRQRGFGWSAATSPVQRAWWGVAPGVHAGAGPRHRPFAAAIARGEPAGLRDDAPVNRAWVVGGDEPGSAGVVGSRRGGSFTPIRRAIAREPAGDASTTPRQPGGRPTSPVQRAWWVPQAFTPGWTTPRPSVNLLGFNGAVGGDRPVQRAWLGSPGRSRRGGSARHRPFAAVNPLAIARG